jgi:adenylate kinase family enzyme
LKAWPIFVWNKIKYFATYQVYFDDTGDMYKTFAGWFDERHPQKFRNVEMKLETDEKEEDECKRWILRRFQLADSNMVFYRNRLLWVRKERRELQGARDRYSMHLNTYSVSGLFARRAINALCEEILERKRREVATTNLKVWMNVPGNYFDSKEVEVVKGLQHIFFDGKEKLIADIEHFVGRKEFYQNRGINYKRSYLFYGRGGTGKSSLATAIAQHLRFDLYVVNLASVTSDGALQNLGHNISSRSVILLEDIDCILEEREVKNDRLNFSTVLNFLDGLYAPSDCIFVLTTNHPEKLDPALIRKGRVDFALEIDYPSATQVMLYLTDFYGQPLGAVLTGQSPVPMSEIQDICLRSERGADAMKEINKIWNTKGAACAV